MSDSSNAPQEVRFTLAPVRLGPIPEDQMTEAQKAAVAAVDRKSTRLNSSHIPLSRMPSSA